MFTQQQHTTEMCFYCQGKIKKFKGDIYVFLSNNSIHFLFLVLQPSLDSCLFIFKEGRGSAEAG